MAKPIIVNLPSGTATKILSASLLPREVLVSFPAGPVFLGTTNTVSDTSDGFLMQSSQIMRLNLLSELWAYNYQSEAYPIYVWVP